MKRIFSYFLQGLLYISPLGVTLFVLYKLFIFLDGIFKPILYDTLNIRIPGLGLVIVFFVVSLLGLIGQTVIAKPVKYLIDHFLNKAPLLKVLYTSIKDLLSAFVGKEKKFNQAVLVKVNLISDLEKLGFITQEDVSHLGVEGNKVAVYFPHSYNFSGELFIVPAEHVKRIDGSSSDIMKFIVSGGVASFENENPNLKENEKI